MSMQQPSLDAIRDEQAKRSLYHFTKQAWGHMDPAPWADGWHLEALADHYQAVVEGEIKRLLVNVPPRHCKSSGVAVTMPAWAWVKYPWTRFLFLSYAEKLSIRDSVKCRRLIGSEWYQTHHGGNFSITTDQNQKTRFDNDRMGSRIASSVGGTATGEGGDIVVVDDPHNAKDKSEVKIGAVIDWWDEVMSTRLNDEKTGAIIIVMQRLHDQDLSGHVLRQGGYEHLFLPAEYEGRKHWVVHRDNDLGTEEMSLEERPESKPMTSLGFEDPRTEQGDPLWEAKFPRDVIEDLKKRMGPYASAGQMAQRPTTREGALFKVEKLQYRDRLPPAHRIKRRLRYWDKAGTEGGGASTAGVLMVECTDGSFGVVDVIEGKWSPFKRNTRIKATAEMDGTETEIVLEQEPGSGGKESALISIKELAGYRVKADKVTGDKATRAEPFADQVEGENVWILRAVWNRRFVAMLELFPVGTDKDIPDAAAGAFNMIKTKGKKRAGTWGRRDSSKKSKPRKSKHNGVNEDGLSLHTRS